jgi:hypothetical protein
MPILLKLIAFPAAAVAALLTTGLVMRARAMAGSR